MRRHHENEYEMYFVISFSCFPTTEGENERGEGNKDHVQMCVCVCVCYLEVLDERPRVLDSVVFL